MPFAHFTHSCGNDLVLKVEMEDVPYFNAPVYLENKESIGKIDEIFGSLHDYYVSVKLSTDIKATSFKVNDKVILHIRFTKVEGNFFRFFRSITFYKICSSDFANFHGIFLCVIKRK